MLNEDDDHSCSGSFPDPSTRHWRHPSEVGGLTVTTAPVDDDNRAYGIGPMFAFGALAFGGSAAALLLFTIGGSALNPDTQLSVTESDISRQQDVAIFEDEQAPVAGAEPTDKSVLGLPEPGSEASNIESFSGSTSDDDLSDDGTEESNPGAAPRNDLGDGVNELVADALKSNGVFTDQTSDDRLASFLVHEQMILTSASSLDGRSSVWLAVADRWVKATVIGIDPYTDVAVVEPTEWIDALSTASLVPVTTQAGSRVRLDPLVGESLNEEIRSVWTGVISSTHDSARNADGHSWYEILSMSMPSDDWVPGSAVLSDAGEVVGMAINSVASLVSAIPFETAVNVAKALIDDGKPSRAWIGVEVATDESGRTRLVAIDPESPARDLLQTGDVIYSVDGTLVVDADHLVFAVRQVGPDADLKLVIHRDGRYRPVTISITTVHSTDGS